MKTRKTWAVLASLAATLGAVALTGCADGDSDFIQGRRVSKYTPPLPPSAYGDWYIDSYSCTVRSRAQDFSMVVDPRPDHGTLQVKALFLAPIVQPPRVEISELLAPVPVEGGRRGYGIILAYDSTNAAHMLKPDTYMTVRYQPITSAQILESSFQTRGLMLALADIANHCEP